MEDLRGHDSRRRSYKSQVFYYINGSQDSKRRHINFMHSRKIHKANNLFAKRFQDFKYDSDEQISNIESEMTEKVGLMMKSHTIGHILCCNCGILIVPNNDNMCEQCLCLKSDITEGLSRHVSILYCSDCERYLHPPTTWVKAQRDSKELLAFCLKKLKKLDTFRLVDAKFLPTEPHSKRITLRLRIQKEISEGLYIEKSHDVEYIVLHQKCPSCMPAIDSNNWEAVVQVRQYVSHMRTFFFLEQLIIRHQAAMLSVKIKPMHQGVDFFFSKQRDAVKFSEFLCKVVPVKGQNFHKQLVSQDFKSNICRYKYNIAAVICPICHEDLIFLPLKTSGGLGVFGPLVICTKVRNTITLLDPFTLQEYIFSAEQYWRAPFKPLLSSRQLVEYIILDVEVDSVRYDITCQKYVLAEVQIARVSDFGRNDTIFTVKTHLGHLLKCGDFALGYDLYGANINDFEAEQYKASLPDVVLIKKRPEKNRRRKLAKASSKKFDCLKKEIDSIDGQDRVRSDYKQFLRDLEVNPESRFRISLDDGSINKSCDLISEPSTTINDDIGNDMMYFSELEDVFADLNLTDGEDGCLME